MNVFRHLGDSRGNRVNVSGGAGETRLQRCWCSLTRLRCVRSCLPRSLHDISCMGRRRWEWWRTVKNVAARLTLATAAEQGTLTFCGFIFALLACHLILFIRGGICFPEIVKGQFNWSVEDWHEGRKEGMRVAVLVITTSRHNDQRSPHWCSQWFVSFLGHEAKVFNSQAKRFSSDFFYSVKITVIDGLT